MNRLTLLSPAKINLYLKVINKRLDGYHNIKTVFERIDLCDEILFVENNNGAIRIKCEHPHVPCGPKNLVYRIAMLLKEEFGVEKGADITIKKRIPVAAGLAGGSSNAATALLGLNKIWNLGISQRKMCSIAAQVGSDVAFFLYDTSWALGTQRGERIKPLDLPAKLWHILVVPRIKMYSSVVYRGLKLQLTKNSDNANILIRNLRNANMLEVGKLLTNDLESVIIRLEPRLVKLKERLKSLNSYGVMISGSGPSVFGLLKSESQALSLKHILQRRYSQVFVVRTL